MLDFENGTLAKRWLHGTRTDEPLGFEGYTGSTDTGSGSAYGLFANRLGSILTAVSISTGAAAADYDYDAFGNQTQTVNTIEQRYGYTGREQDYETGLIYYRARHYYPATGQFIQRDPIGFAAGDLNLYAYVENDPYRRVDPTGPSSQFTEFRRTAGVAAANALRATGKVTLGTLSLAALIAEALDAAAYLADYNDILNGNGGNGSGKPGKCHGNS
ncbi:RHS repeat-associated core domain-containing protein [Ruegeria sp.]|uniref:RHS repeat-associated core domain-containing protein n=1 Tax=Ruegeria sp. TaxID=1879320 RepID=UPI00230CB136|nr:RHS repeat-associated core domain-containing protein [Ruegeria sp.]MDA7966142.1 RHS repeat-associated core domain-containing protein [Ruegeria sp.]